MLTTFKNLEKQFSNEPANYLSAFGNHNSFVDKELNINIFYLTKPKTSHSVSADVRDVLSVRFAKAQMVCRLRWRW
jgi:hypothetical protein